MRVSLKQVSIYNQVIPPLHNEEYTQQENKQCIEIARMRFACVGIFACLING